MSGGVSWIPRELAAIIPGCRGVTQDGPDSYSAQVVIGVAGIRGTYQAQIELRDKREGSSLRLSAKPQEHWASDPDQAW